MSFVLNAIGRLRETFTGTTPDPTVATPSRRSNRLGGMPPDSRPLDDCIIPGIENVGNSCYLTQVLLMLYTNHCVKKYITSRIHQIAASRSSSKHTEDNCMACMFCELGDQFYRKIMTGRKVHPGRIVKAFCERSGLLNGRQHDCSEAYTKLVEMLIEDMKGDDASGVNSLSEIFHTMVNEQTTCNQCGSSTSTCDPSATMIYVPIPKQAFSFQDCLEPRKSIIHDCTCRTCGMFACMRILRHSYACIGIHIQLAIMRVFV
jgi:ubiquitin C-terminal hydrolase